MSDRSENRRRGKALGHSGRILVLALAMLLAATMGFAAVETNRLVSMRVDTVKGHPALRIITKKPIGYRYVVYDSYDPARVVLNFPHMDIAAVSTLSDVNQPPVEKVEASSHTLPGGRMCRVQVVLSRMADYDIATNGNEFVLTLKPKTGPTVTGPVGTVADQTEPLAVLPPASAEEQKPVLLAAPAAVKALAAPARKIINVDSGVQVVTLQADGAVQNYKFFRLDGPERLVVDVYGVKAGFDVRAFPLQGDFSEVRVGIYQDKLRFVFDAPGEFPPYAVTSNGESVVIRWGSAAGGHRP